MIRDEKNLIGSNGKKIKTLRLCILMLFVSGCVTDVNVTEKAKRGVTFQFDKLSDDPWKMPIADLHDHDNYAEINGAKVGVFWAGLGTKRGGRDNWLVIKNRLGARRIAWSGQHEFNRLFFSGGVERMLDAEEPLLKTLYNESESDLKSGLIVGIGEIFVNNKNSGSVNFRRKAPLNAPVFKKFFDLVSKYDGFLSFHMEGDQDSLEQLSELLLSNRKGRILLNHCGVAMSVVQLRRLFEAHSNVFCELSYRYPPMNKKSEREIFNLQGIHQNWRDLIESYADRFLIGTDASSKSSFIEAIQVVRAGLLSNLKPETARKIAWENAAHLFILRE